ncbi:hypothetical protein I5H01_gp017 [Mycobacterium phage MarkPhew]|uniref:Uncharacterized protein n=1 Tax=Mycobacterium phage MarkPhew TaxID=2725625 RepID=A0A6M3SYT9_9CAUD|nr:hypothetical protein I5H01_gp017 [Mycobacterium phage MarkPhew]QJD50390.1 hypothetical protein SEA_MARKPHEW_90 [Mycobacterium phage MarkPhew]
MASSQVIFLDGPLAGQVREVPSAHYDQSDEPRPSFLFDVQTYSGTWDAPQRETVTYRLKPNRLSTGPRWAFAVGEKVGEQVVCTQAFSPDAIEAMGGDHFEQMVTYHAEKALNGTCSAEGLHVAEITEVFRGTRRDAIAAAYLQQPDGIKAAAALRNVEALGEYLASQVWVIHEGVAVMPS